MSFALALQPPVKPKPAFQIANAVLIADCVWQAASDWLAGQIIANTAGDATVKVLVQTTGASQLLVTVQVTVVLPPQTFGAIGLAGDLLKLDPQPPLYEYEPNQLVKAVFIAS